MVTHSPTLGPVSRVLAALEEGAPSLAEVSARTGLRRDVVDAAVDHLVRLGRLETRTLAIGCPGSGCGSCVSARVDGSPECGADGPSRRRSGPVLVALSVRR